MHAIRYCLAEAGRTLWRHPSTTALSGVTIALAAVVLGGFLAVSVNLGRMVDRWTTAAEVSIYLRDDITADQRVALNQALAMDPAVADRTFVSKTDALARFTRDFPDLALAFEGGAENPLPASIDVRLKPGASEASAAEALAARVRRAPGVADVRFDRTWLVRLASIIAGLRWAGWILGGVLTLAGVLTVSTVVRLTLHARRDEFEIMRLMGAPLGLLRGPLVVEGVLLGGGGAALALVVLVAAGEGVRTAMGGAWTSLIEPGSLTWISAAQGTALVAGAMVLGGLGGWLVARRVR